MMKHLDRGSSIKTAKETLKLNHPTRNTYQPNKMCFPVAQIASSVHTESIRYVTNPYGQSSYTRVVTDQVVRSNNYGPSYRAVRYW